VIAGDDGVDRVVGQGDQCACQEDGDVLEQSGGGGSDLAGPRGGFLRQRPPGEAPPNPPRLPFRPPPQNARLCNQKIQKLTCTRHEVTNKLACTPQKRLVGRNWDSLHGTGRRRLRPPLYIDWLVNGPKDKTYKRDSTFSEFLDNVFSLLFTCYGVKINQR